MILVTGAAGHIGNVLVRELLQRGEPVRALVLPGEDITSLSGLPVELSYGDVLHPDTLTPAFEGIEYVYHLAGIISIQPGMQAFMRQVNVEGTRNVLSAARHAKVRRLVYTSSIHALGRPPRGTTITESQRFDVHNPAGPYDRSKAEASLEVLRAVREGLDAVIICPTGVIGPHDYRGSEMGAVLSAFLRHRWSVLVDGMFDFVDVRDVARGHILACERGRQGETYILGNERVSAVWLWATVRDATGLRSQTLVLPLQLAKLVASLALQYARMVHRTAVFTPYALETLNSSSNVSHDKALRELGYQPRSLVDTVRDTVRWWQEHGNGRGTYKFV